MSALEKKADIQTLLAKQESGLDAPTRRRLELTTTTGDADDAGAQDELVGYVGAKQCQLRVAIAVRPRQSGVELRVGFLKAIRRWGIFRQSAHYNRGNPAVTP